MSWFGIGNKRKRDQVKDIKLADTNLIEVVAHKSANKQVVEEAKKTSEQLNSLLVKNGFTLKIYLAAGHSVVEKEDK